MDKRDNEVGFSIRVLAGLMATLIWYIFTMFFIENSEGLFDNITLDGVLVVSFFFTLALILTSAALFGKVPRSLMSLISAGRYKGPES